MYKMTDEEFYEVYGRMPRRTPPKKKKVKIYWGRIIIALIILVLIIFGIVKLVMLIVGKVKGDSDEKKDTSSAAVVNSEDDYYAEPQNKEADAEYQDIELTVCIDAAHGGFDKGTEGSGRLEKDDTLNIANALKEHLESYGVKVIMTRTDDSFISVEDRAAAANDQGADLMISIHRSSTDVADSDIHGFEAWINNAEPEMDKAFARHIMTKLEEIGISENKGVRKGYDGDKAVNYPINELTKMPSVLLDMGYVTSSIDNQLLDANLEAYARAIGNGIIESAVEQGIIEESGKRIKEGQLISDKPSVTVKTEEPQPDESSEEDTEQGEESEAEEENVYNEWEQYTDESAEQQEQDDQQAADDYVYTDDGMGYYTEPMMTE